jgi:hypothetical protein
MTVASGWWLVAEPNDAAYKFFDHTKIKHLGAPF